MSRPKGSKKTSGSGRKKGAKNKKTLEKEKELEVYQQAILQRLKPLMNAHFAVAEGTQIIVAREKIWDKKKKRKVRKGRFVRIIHEKEILELFNSKEKQGENYYTIFTKDPNPKALEDLMNRVFGKPQEKIEVGWSKEIKEALDKVDKLLP